MKNLIILLFFVFGLSPFSIVGAQHTAHDAHDTEAGHVEKHSAHNHIAIFNGVSSNLKYDVTSYSLGLDYEHYLNDIGIGLFGEIIFADETEFLTGISASYTKGHIKFMTGPFVEFAKSHDHSTSNSEAYHNKYGVRAGIAYNMHWHKLAISPGVYTDYIEGGIWVLVYGVGIGFGF